MYTLFAPTLVAGTPSLEKNHLQPFTTRDSDNDKKNCATMAGYPQGGFWYNSCSRLFPNAKYQNQEECLKNNGIIWHTDWLEKDQSLKWTELMLRRTNGKCY